MPNTEEYINKMYDASLESEKAGLKQNYEQDTANLDAEQEKAKKQTDANLTRTYVEAAKAQKNYNEVQNAYGLTSGAMAQARLSQDNQLQGDLTAIRTAQQDIDAGIERERSTLAQQFAAAIQQAQANNDLQRAQALFDAAQAEEARLNQQKANAANLMAGVGDYARLAELYGLTAEELALLMGKSGSGNSGSGGYTGENEQPGGLFGYTPEELAAIYANAEAAEQLKKRQHSQFVGGGGGSGRVNRVAHE
jgi:transcriptional regulator with GAF, ATPase, and Fis domain